MKAIQTMEWIASWDAFDPASQAAELLLIEADIRLLEKIGKQANDDGNTFIDGVLTTDGMMRNATVKPESGRGKAATKSKNAEVVSDQEQYNNWQADEAA